MRDRLLETAKSFLQPASVATNIAWYLIFLAISSVGSVIGAAFFHLSFVEQIVLGIALLLLFLAGAIMWQQMGSKRRRHQEKVAKRAETPPTVLPKATIQSTSPSSAVVYVPPGGELDSLTMLRNRVSGFDSVVKNEGRIGDAELSDNEISKS